MLSFGWTAYFLSFVASISSLPIKPNGIESSTSNSNKTNITDCVGITCPIDKICIVDSTVGEGYKCCSNVKCSNKAVKTRCKDPGEIANATRIPSSRKFQPGERVVYSCNKDYYFVRPFGTLVTCLSDGTWSQPMPKCSKMRVLPPLLPDIKTYPTPSESTISTSTPDDQSNDKTVIVVLIIVLIVLIIGVFVFFMVRYKYQTGDFYWPCQQENPDGIVLENTIIPEKPDLEQNAVPVAEFAQYVALGHSNTDQKFCEEFEDIQNHAISGLTWESCLLPENRDKNRYINIVAYDHSRVRLHVPRRRQHSGLHRSSDYINANYVSSYEKPRAYIACQGPMPNTYNEFWRMIWENNVSVIIMITNLIENGRRKCDQYWPHEGRDQYKHICVTLRDTDTYANYTVRTFTIRNTKQNRTHARGGERKVLQFHYTQWPDHGTPEYILPVLTFIRRSSLANPIDSGPMVIHCSAGVGRTGAYIMLHSMMQMARETFKVNINGFLRFIRTQRNHLVQTEDQYIFVHDALLCHFTCGDTECPARQLQDLVDRLLMTSTPRNNGISSAEGSGDKVDTNGAQAKDTKGGKHRVPGRTAMEKQFMNIVHYHHRDIDYDFALRAVNQGKNRPKGVLPIFRSRVPLHFRTGKEGSEYINASFVQGYRNSSSFVITQLPMKHTLQDFWQLVWDHNCFTIITIKDEEWNEETDVYWPSQDKPLNCSAFNVSFGSQSLLSLNDEGPTTLTERNFILEATKDDYVLAVRQLEINGWPSLEKLGPQFLQVIKTVVKYTSGKEGHAVIQDRYGGTPACQLVCVQSLHQQLANENAVDVFQTAKVAYQMRPRTFTSHVHLHFLYKAMLLETNPAKKVPAKSTSNGGKSTTCKESKADDSVTKLDKEAKENGKSRPENDYMTGDEVSFTKTPQSDVKEVLLEDKNSSSLEGNAELIPLLEKSFEQNTVTTAEDKPLLMSDDDDPDQVEEELLESPLLDAFDEADQSTITQNTLLLED